VLYGINKRGVRMRNNLVALSIFCLGLCFVIGSWLISNSLSDEEITQVKQTQYNELLTISEVAKYLGLSNEEVVKLTETPHGDHSYSSEIPHIKIDKTYYYPKKAIDQWLLAVELTVVR
jgi:hypothetical protein